MIENYIRSQERTTLVSRAMKQDRLLSIQSATKDLKITGASRYAKNRAAILALGILERRQGEELPRKKEIIQQVRDTYSRKGYGAISWVWLIYFIIPRVVSWAIEWYLERSRQEREGLVVVEESPAESDAMDRAFRDIPEN